MGTLLISRTGCSTTASMDVTSAYNEKIAKGEIVDDTDQRAAVMRLSQLEKDLSRIGPRRRWWQRKTKVLPLRGVYLYGGVGRGKSMVMDLFFKTVSIAAKRRVHFHAFMLEVHDFLHSRRAGKTVIDDGLIAFADKVAAGTRLLCFDEFQVKDVADAMILGRLFTALFDRGIAIVMTSNIAPDDLYHDGLQRDRFLPFISLLKQKTDVMYFSGGRDYRLDRLIGRKVMFTPHDVDAGQAMDRLFLDIADGQTGEPVTIEVKGRQIMVPRAAHEICDFTFDALCSAARSAVDYLALTARYRVFIVRDMPHLDDSRRDAVLRFITLVDTLYDYHACLILSMARPIERIYTGETHAAAFARTQSRLAEMQSPDYIGWKG